MGAAARMHKCTPNVEAGGQLAGNGSLLPPCGPNGSNSGQQVRPLDLFLRRSLHQAPPLPSVSFWTLVARTSVRLTIPYYLQCVWQTKAKQEKVDEDLAT